MELSDKMPMHLCRPFVDFQNSEITSETLGFYSDASRNSRLGMGANFGDNWLIARWPDHFIMELEPSIWFLELYAFIVAVITWNGNPKLSNGRIAVHCDNEAVVHMINSTASSCAQCRKLIRILTLDGIRSNRRLFAKHIHSRDNVLSDALSRLDLKRFWKNVPSTMRRQPDPKLDSIWPPNKIWNDQMCEYLDFYSIPTSF